MSSPERQYHYTVTTPHGDVNLTTPYHHSMFKDVEEFLKHHQPTIATAISVSSLVVSGLGLYLSHGRAGAKLK